AVDRPLLSKPAGERLQFLDGLGELELAIAPQGQHERANLALLLDQQPLQLLQVQLHLCRPGASNDRLHPEGGAGEELDDAVVDVAREREASPRRSALLDCRKEGVMIQHRTGSTRQLYAEIQAIDRKLRDVPQHEPAVARAAAYLCNEALDGSRRANRLCIEELRGRSEAVPAMAALRQRAVMVEVEHDDRKRLVHQRSLG